MNLGGTVIYCALEGCYYMRASLCRLCMPSAFGVTAGFHVDSSHIFPQDALAAITWMGCVADISGTGA